jgi:Uma2 family endonuclease
MQVKDQHYYSPEAYLELEAAAEFRSEYYDGQIFPMAGGTPNHNRIAGNIYAALNLAFTDQDFDVFMSDLRLWIPRKSLYTYPDIMVVAGELAFAEGRKDTITNPVAIVEVLSDSTKNYDSPLETLRERGEKFEFYRTLFSFREYLLIDQNKIYVEHCIKTTDNKWLLAEYEDVDTTLSFASIPFQISLAVIYKKVIF